MDINYENIVSVIVPIYKAENYLENCINSIVNQTYSKLEIILIDDGSPDACGEICDEYAKLDTRIKVIHKKNEGVAAARNDGLKAVTGAYVMFVDSDDWIETNMVEEMIKTIKKYEADVVECGYNIRHKKRLVPVYNDNKIFEINGIENIINASLCNAIPSLYKVCWAKLIKVESCLGVFFPQRTIAEDVAFCDRVFVQCQKIVKMHYPFYNYRQTVASITRGRIDYTVFEPLYSVIELKSLLLNSSHSFSSKMFSDVDNAIVDTCFDILDNILLHACKPQSMDGYKVFYQTCKSVEKSMNKSPKQQELEKYISAPDKWIKKRKKRNVLKRIKYIISKKLRGY